MTPRSPFRAAVLAVAMIGVGCGSEGPPASSVVSIAGRGMISSSAFADGEPMPARFTCDGDDVSPPLRWAAPEEGPPGADYAIVVVDVDAPGGPFVHWLVYALPPSGSIPEGGPVPGSEGENTFGDDGYGGPCPPGGDGPHRYEFRLYALGPPVTPLSAGMSVDDVLGGVPDEPGLATLTGTYDRD